MDFIFIWIINVLLIKNGFWFFWGFFKNFLFMDNNIIILNVIYLKYNNIKYFKLLIKYKLIFSISVFDFFIFCKY